MKAYDLRRAGVKHARSMVVFTNAAMPSHGEGSHREWLMDADSVCIYT